MRRVPLDRLKTDDLETLTREFCGACGSGVLEYGAHAGENVYLFYGSLDEPDALPPKAEFFCKDRADWMPEIAGKLAGAGARSPQRY